MIYRTCPVYFACLIHKKQLIRPFGLDIQHLSNPSCHCTITCANSNIKKIAITDSAAHNHQLHQVFASLLHLTSRACAIKIGPISPYRAEELPRRFSPHTILPPRTSHHLSRLRRRARLPKPVITHCIGATPIIQARAAPNQSASNWK